MAYAVEISEISSAENSKFKTAKKLFKEVLISPKVTIDDFDTLSEFDEVFYFLLDVAQGNITEEIMSESQLKKRARKNWPLWRLVLSNRGFSYQTVFGKPYLSQQDVIEANFALDMQIEAEKKAARKK